MRNKIIFTGPVYPPTEIIDYITSVSINIIENKLRADRIIPNYVYITSLIIDSGVVRATIKVSNDIGMSYEMSTDNEGIRIITKNMDSDINFSGNNQIYNVSPCCVTITCEENDNQNNESGSRDVSVSCNSPLTITNTEDELRISAEELPIALLETPAMDYAEGIKTINGVGLNESGVTISGTGSVDVVIAPVAGHLPG